MPALKCSEQGTCLPRAALPRPLVTTMSQIKLHFSPSPPERDDFQHVTFSGEDNLHEFVSSLPWPERSVDAIIVDGLLERLSQADCVRFLHECRRVMVADATLCIRAPDLDGIVNDYVADRIAPQWEREGIYWTDNRCERLNLMLATSRTGWLYNEQELSRLGEMVGLRPNGKLPAPDNGNHPSGNPTPLAVFGFTKPQRRLAPDAQPLVTISIPSYKPQYFDAALTSAVNQTYRNLDIVICDDCPDDGIRKIVERYATYDKRIRYLHNPIRLRRENLAKCLDVAQGEFFRLLCDDDLLDESAVEKMLDCFRNNDDITLVTSRRQRIDERGARLPDIFETLAPVSQDALVDGISLGTALLSSARNFVGEPTTAMFRKAEVAHIRPDYCSVDGQIIDGMNDVAVWINLATRGDTIYLTDTLSSFRCHPEQNQQLHRDMLVERSLNALQIMRRSFDRFGFSDGQFFGTIKWKPLTNPATNWKRQTIRQDYSGWSATGDSPSSSAESEESRYRAAADLLAKGDTEKAIAALIALAEAGSSHWAVYNDLGAYAWQTGDASSAIELFGKAWQLHQTTPLTGCNLAQALLALEQWNKAESLIADLQNRHPGNTDVQILLQRLDQARG